MIQVTQTQPNHTSGSATTTLKLLSGPRRGTHFELPEGQFWTGRSRRCDLRLIEPSINRVHCVLERTPDEVTVRDLNSISGTYVNGKAVRGTWKIFVGDVLRVGEFTFELATGAAGQNDSREYRFDPLSDSGEQDLWANERPSAFGRIGTARAAGSHPRIREYYGDRNFADANSAAEATVRQLCPNQRSATHDK